MKFRRVSFALGCAGQDSVLFSSPSIGKTQVPSIFDAFSATKLDSRTATKSIAGSAPESTLHLQKVKGVSHELCKAYTTTRIAGRLASSNVSRGCNRYEYNNNHNARRY